MREERNPVYELHADDVAQINKGFFVSRETNEILRIQGIDFETGAFIVDGGRYINFEDVVRHSGGNEQWQHQ